MKYELKHLMMIGLALALASCGSEDPSAMTDPVPAPTTGSTDKVQQTDDKRSSWQDPNVLMEYIGDIRGKQVAVLFAEDGHFAPELIEAGARVIAVSPDAAKVKVLEHFKKDKGYSDDQFIVRGTTAGDPGLGMDKLERIIVANRYGSLPDRSAYFTKVKSNLVHGGQLFIIDWHPRQTPIGPPQEMRVDVNQIMEELEPAGFTDISARTNLYPYHYLVLATDFIAMDE